MAARLGWKKKTTPESLHAALRILADEYPIVESGKADIKLEFIADDSRLGFGIARKKDRATIRFSQTCDALRAAGTLLAETAPADGEYSEESCFTTMGIMLDCSRNAVMKVDYFKRWLRRLALMGFNMAMLYTEDTYQLPGEDYFGYMRGRYTAEELKEIDDYAHSLGIEMIGCIQTLGHLTQILKWSAYRNVEDTSSVLLVGKEETYELIEKMIVLHAEVFRSRRIHVGMDETHDLGRGQYLDLFGPKKGYDLFNEHLKRVVDICGTHGMKPMIWSDMFFRMGSPDGHGYYDKDTVIPEDVKAAIPKEVELVYWDYYHKDEEFYLDWISRHRDLGSEPVMGSGVWTWHIPWYGREMTESTAVPCVQACRKVGLKEIFFTMWGDDGGYCDYDSSLAGLALVAELAYTGKSEGEALEKRFRAVCSGSYAANVLAGDLGVPGKTECYLWDDPLLGIIYHQAKASNPEKWDREAAEYEALAKKLAKYKDDRGAGEIAHAILMAETIAAKMKLCSQLREAYSRKDKTALKSLVSGIPGVTSLLSDLDKSFRRQWLKRNKPFGLEVMQIRMAGQVRRFNEMAERFEEFLSGKIERIAEFDEPLPKRARPLDRQSYRDLATGSCNF